MAFAAGAFGHSRWSDEWCAGTASRGGHRRVRELGGVSVPVANGLRARHLLMMSLNPIVLTECQPDTRQNSPQRLQYPILAIFR
jgi:hypothetical protein